MKKLKIISIILLAVCLLTACGNKIRGTYYSQSNEDEYIIIKTKNEYISKELGTEFEGKYKIDGDTIIFETFIGDADGTIDGDKIILGSSEYIKK